MSVHAQSGPQSSDALLKDRRSVVESKNNLVDDSTSSIVTAQNLSIRSEEVSAISPKNTAIIDAIHTKQEHTFDDLHSNDKDRLDNIFLNPRPSCPVVTPKSSSFFRYKDSSEISPLKEAVKGFVLSKLTKKPGISESGLVTADNERRTLFSGIKEKLVKRLEDNIGKTSSSAYELSTPKSDIKSNSIPDLHSELAGRSECELKSLVANVLYESSTVEVADECFEETKSSIDLTSTHISRSRTISDIAATAQHILRPKRVMEKDLSISFSNLQKTEELDKDSVEEENEEHCTKILETPAYSSSGSVQLDGPIPDDSPSDVGVQELSTQQTFVIFVLKIFKGALFLIFGLFGHSIWTYTIVIFIAMLNGNILPIPPFIAGMLNGLLIAFAAIGLYKKFCHAPDTKCPLPYPDYKTLPPLTIPISPVEQSDLYKGWMNELKVAYDPENYKVSSTVSVYVRLQGNQLRLSYPRKNIPKRAMWNEKEQNCAFLLQAHHSLVGAKIILCPEGLPRGRIWNKKYPLCIVLSSESDIKRSPSLERCQIAGATLSEPISKCPSSHSLPSSLSGSPAHQSTSGPVQLNTIYLFARTDREKEEWYWRLYRASNEPASGTFQLKEFSGLIPSLDITCPDAGPSTDKTLKIVPNLKDDPQGSKACRKKPTLEFDHYMGLLLCPENSNEETTDTAQSTSQNCAVQWLNIFLGRLFYDFLTQKCWLEVVKERMQRKLSRIKMPTWMEELKVTDIYLGTALPQIRRTSLPVRDERGLWLDLDIDYNGSFQMTLESKINLTGVKQDALQEELDSNLEAKGSSPASCPLVNNSGSSSEEEEDMVESELAKGGSSLPRSSIGTGSKIFNMLERLVSSGHFHHMTENKFLRRKMEELKNTPLILTVEMNGLFGTLALNVPPPPTDRLWYGFRSNPILSLSAYPKFGAREINLSPVVQMIERKLIQEFQKVFVMPNMDDLLIPIMHSSIYDQ